MTREIKFRAWSKLNKKMLPTNMALHDLIIFFVKEADPKLISVSVLPQFVEFMQYTCLNDKNEKEIYEGDIIKSGQHYSNPNASDSGEVDVNNSEPAMIFSESIEIVQFIGGRFVVYDKLISENSDHAYYAASLAERMGKQQGGFNSEVGVVIIGNIYENPELLK